VLEEHSFYSRLFARGIIAKMGYKFQARFIFRDKTVRDWVKKHGGKIRAVIMLGS
jgi:hypothetical protein